MFFWSSSQTAGCRKTGLSTSEYWERFQLAPEWQATASGAGLVTLGGHRGHHQRQLSAQMSCQFEGSQFWIIPGQPHAPQGKARIDIAQHTDGALELLYRGQALAYRSHMLHEHLQQPKLADDKTVNQRVDELTKEQRRQLTLRAHIEMQEDMRGHGILQPDTHISPPPLGQGRYGLRPAQPCPSA